MEKEEKDAIEKAIPDRAPDQKDAQEEIEHKTPHEVWVALGGIVLIVIIAAIIFIPALVRLNSK